MNFGSGNALDSLRRIRRWIHNDYFCSTGGWVPSAIGLETAVELIVETTQEDKVRMQVCLWQRISKKDNFLWSTEYIGGVLPQLPKDGRAKILEVRRRDDEWRVLLS